MSSDAGSHVPAELEPVDAIETATVLGHLHPLGEPIVRDHTVPFLERNA